MIKNLGYNPYFYDQVNTLQMQNLPDTLQIQNLPNSLQMQNVPNIPDTFYNVGYNPLLTNYYNGYMNNDLYDPKNAYSANYATKPNKMSNLLKALGSGAEAGLNDIIKLSPLDRTSKFSMPQNPMLPNLFNTNSVLLQNSNLFNPSNYATTSMSLLSKLYTTTSLPRLNEQYGTTLLPLLSTNVNYGNAGNHRSKKTGKNFAQSYFIKEISYNHEKKFSFTIQQFDFAFDNFF